MYSSVACAEADKSSIASEHVSNIYRRDKHRMADIMVLITCCTMQVWAEPVPEAPEPQGCAATLEKEASGEQATMPPSLPAEGANAASLVALSTERMQVASAASRRLPQASAEQGQHTEAAPSQHGDLSQPAQQPPAVHSPSQPKESAGAAEEDNLLHPSLTTAPGSYIGNEDASSSPPLHPLLQVPFLPNGVTLF